MHVCVISTHRVFASVDEMIKSERKVKCVQQE